MLFLNKVLGYNAHSVVTEYMQCQLPKLQIMLVLNLDKDINKNCMPFVEFIACMVVL